MPPPTHKWVGRGSRAKAMMTAGELLAVPERIRRPSHLPPPPTRPHREKFLSPEHADEVKKYARDTLDRKRERRVANDERKRQEAESAMLSELKNAKTTGPLMESLPADADEFLEEEERDGYDISSRHKRLSRAARFGISGLPDRTQIMMPEKWNETVENLFHQANQDVLRKDFRRKTAAESLKGITPQRLSVLHLITSSQARYGSMRTVLRQIRARLGPDEEGFSEETLSDQWTPSRVVEYNCGAGEGMWGVAEVFGEEAEKAGRVLAYEGFDTRVPLLRVAVDMLDVARSDATRTTPEEGKTSSSTKPLSNAEPPVSATAKALSAMNVSLRTASQSANLAAQRVSGIKDDPTVSEPTEGNGTLVICNHTLMNLDSDVQRSNFVKSLWERHPSAEVIALVEEGSERGFACIASAREDLLGIGVKSQAAYGTAAFTQGKNVFFEEASKSKDDASGEERLEKAAAKWPECHVVAPCPHDRPCPLLHDYAFLNGQEKPTGGSNPDASSLFHGAPIGQAVCTTPYTMHVPKFSRTFRPQTLYNHAEEKLTMSYVIVRRGPRPGMTEKSDRLTNTQDEAATLRAELRLRAARTKKGQLAELRAGTPMESPKEIPVAEEIGKDDTEAAENAAATMAAMAGIEDAEARQELLRMLPDLLRQQSEQNGDEVSDGAESEAQDAMRLAQRIMEQSAELADSTSEEQGATGSAAAEEHAARSATSMLLDQQRELASQDQADEIADDETLQKEDVESMRAEAYEWPRLVRSPIKKTGHVIMDACSANGAIVRFIVAKSAGQQMYQDARKAFWGASLPYIPILEEPVANQSDNDDNATSADAQTGTTTTTSERATVEVQNIKTVIQRVPAASLTERNDAYTTDKMQAIPRRQRNKMPRRLPEVRWPASSALAIGPDLIARRYVPDLPFAWRADNLHEAPKTGQGREVPAVQFSRRSFYQSGEGRGAERFRDARPSRSNTELDLPTVEHAMAEVGLNDAQRDTDAAQHGESAAEDDADEHSDHFVDPSDGDIEEQARREHVN